MKQKSISEGPKFVEPAKKGRYYFVILVLLIALAALGYFYSEINSENSDLKRQLEQTSVTTTTMSLSPVSRETTTTVPSAEIAKVDIIARNNDSDRTTSRIEQDFAGQVQVTQVSSDTAISSTVIVVNNPAFEDLAQEIVTALSGTVGLVPEGQQASVADIVIYVKS
jgi:hypothetical protein